LREEAQQDYANALAGFEARSGDLHRIRSHVVHYPELKSQRGQKKKRLMQRVLEAHQDTPTVVKAGKMSDARMIFADDVVAEVFQVTSGGEERLHAVHAEIAKAQVPLIGFLGAVMDEYFARRRADGLTMEEVELVDPTDWDKGWKAVGK
jgi:hypothetical protein